MKTKILAVLVVLLALTGCSSHQPTIVKNKELPSWVNSDDSLSAVGSATYKGQSYIQQRNEAQAIAMMNLGRKIETKVDSLVKNYYRTTGAKDSLNEELNSQTTSQVSSQILRGVTLSQVYVADDGEMFVKVVLDVNQAMDYANGDAKFKKYLYEQFQAEKSFKELKSEVKEYKEQQ